MRLSDQELRELYDRVTFYSVAGTPLNEEDSLAVRYLIDHYRTARLPTRNGVSQTLSSKTARVS